MKRLFTKCRESNCSEFQALLDWRNTPTEGVGSSPAQRFLGRRCKTLLPAHGALLKPLYPTKDDTKAINQQKYRQQYYYDAHARPLKPLATGDSVRMRLPGEKTWSPGICAGLVGPRSYEVKVGDRTFVRNRRHLIRSQEPARDDTEGEEHMEQQTGSEDTVTPSVADPEAPTEGLAPEARGGSSPDRTLATPGVRRSGRNRQCPEHYGNYVYY